MQYPSDAAAVDALKEKYNRLKEEIGRIVVGQEETIHRVLVSIFSDGHSLLVGVPGMAKTLLIKTIADTLDMSFKRIQFTPDLMPGDIMGNEILDDTRQFKFIKGPVFANIILADEINRTPPKTQAALLEAMQERHVTIAGQMYPLPKPFFVLATQNPIEQEGTYPLPEAQLDRFMFNITLDYLSFKDELQMVKNTTSGHTATVNKVMNAEEIVFFQQLVRKIPVAENVLEYAVTLASKSRPGQPKATDKVNSYIQWGAGPRASQFLVLGAKCHAALTGKYSPDIEDVQAVAIPIMQHRMVRNYKAEAEGITLDNIIKSLF